MVHVQTAYCHTSLGSQIVFERIGDYIYIDKELRICEIEKYEQEGEFTENNIGDANLMVYLVNKKGGGGPSMKYCKHFVGVANFGVVCSEDRRMAHSFNLFDNKYGLANDAWVSSS